MKFWEWSWEQLVDAAVLDGAFVVTVGPLVWLTALATATGWALWRKPWKRWRKRWRPVTFRVALLGLECEIAATSETAQIAHEAYVEMITRKAALPFDEKHDALSEVYDSWYDLFVELRGLARNISAQEVRDERGVCDLLDVLTRVLNDALRPHLTRWQGPYRTWLEHARNSGALEPESALQRQFPDYEELVGNLKLTNAALTQLSLDLRELAHGTAR